MLQRYDHAKRDETTLAELSQVGVVRFLLVALEHELVEAGLCPELLDREAFPLDGSLDDVGIRCILLRPDVEGALVGEALRCTDLRDAHLIGGVTVPVCLGR